MVVFDDPPFFSVKQLWSVGSKTKKQNVLLVFHFRVELIDILLEL